MRFLRIETPPLLEVGTGCDVHSAITEAIEVCHVLKSRVRIRFNGFEFDVYPTANDAAAAALEAAKGDAE